MTHPTEGRAVATEPRGETQTTACPPHRPPQKPRRTVRLRPATSATRWCMLLAAAVVLAVSVLAASGCGSASQDSSDQGGKPRELTVFAAASLTDVFTQIGDAFTAANPDVEVTFSFAASNDLVTQVQQGAPADVLATADTSTMDRAGELVTGPRPFATNKLVIAVAPGNPKNVTGLADLSRDDLKVVLAAPEVPAGKYAAEIFTRAGVQVDPVSLEVTVKGVVTKVALGEADAGIVYVTDVTAAQGEIEGVTIPDDENVIAVYPLGAVAASSLPADASAFVEFVLASDGQDFLAKAGFLPPP